MCSLFSTNSPSFSHLLNVHVLAVSTYPHLTTPIKYMNKRNVKHIRYQWQGFYAKVSWFGRGFNPSVIDSQSSASNCDILSSLVLRRSNLLQWLLSTALRKLESSCSIYSRIPESGYSPWLSLVNTWWAVRFSWVLASKVPSLIICKGSYRICWILFWTFLQKNKWWKASGTLTECYQWMWVIRNTLNSSVMLAEKLCARTCFEK